MQHATGDIGGRLRSAREERGLTLRQVANRTKLSLGALQAIERNEFTQLPAGLFRKAYVRMLAAELGLDAGALARDYSARFEPPATDETPPTPSLTTFSHRLLGSTTAAKLSAALAAWSRAWLGLRPASSDSPSKQV
ncbi:MAG: hypothetical protein A3J29_16345 [Acidobacteria bacterium RIFCSPLOWO2_12_FULL_67_14b]|nr:MAG: hypothetical protein A3J29_16345 [Acidobacteria bacterium RIFCSPLOWO2_12_FULL_67_14b]